MKNLKMLSRTGQFILCNNSLEKKLLKNNFGGYDLYIERLSVP